MGEILRLKQAERVLGSTFIFPFYKKSIEKIDL